MKLTALLLLCLIGVLFRPMEALAGPTSASYELKTYSFGSGGSTTDTGSTNFNSFGNSGEIEFDPSSTNYTFGGGLNYSLQADTPQAPTLVNANSNYDRLNFTLTPGVDPTDTTYAIAISPDGFTTTQYITHNLTLSSTLAVADYQN